MEYSMEDLQTKSSNDVGLRYNHYQTSFAIQQLDVLQFFYLYQKYVETILKLSHCLPFSQTYVETGVV